MNRQKLALLIVLVVLVLAVTWSFISAPRQKTVNSLKEGPGQTQQIKKTASISSSTPVKTTAKVDAKPAVASDERALRLDLLERELSGFKGYRRNLFKPIFADEIKLMKQKAVASKPVALPPIAVVAQKPVTPPPVVQPVVEPETHQSTLAHFIFLGFVKKDNRKTIFLSKDKEIILVRKGEIFAKRYEPTVITDQALTIRVTDTGEEIVIPLNENKPLAAVSKK
jgi:hypothetical protein